MWRNYSFYYLPAIASCNILITDTILKGGNPVKIAICDDNSIMRERLRALLEEYYQSLDVIIEQFASGEDICQTVSSQPDRFDCIFMDIEMPGIDGMTAARRIRAFNKKVPVIFLTSYSEFAADGYEVNAFRYLTKPVDEGKLIEALDKLKSKGSSEGKVIVFDGKKEVVLSYEDIIYIKSENVYLRFYTAEGSFLVRQKMKTQIGSLPALYFMQVHRSYVINLNHVASFDGRNVTMDQGDLVPVSDKWKSELPARLAAYLRETK